MKKIIILGVICLFVGLGFTSISGIQINSQVIKTSERGNILYVGGSGPGNYSRIQDAIDNSSDGDTVFVFDDSSPYYENVIVDKSITLIGEDTSSTVIDGSGIDSVIIISVDHVCIEGFTITNCKHDLSDAGINIFSDWNIIKKNNIMENQNMGIRLSGSHYNIRPFA